MLRKLRLKILTGTSRNSNIFEAVIAYKLNKQELALVSKIHITIFVVIY